MPNSAIQPAAQHRSLLGVVALCCAAAIGGCGSSAHSTGPAASGRALVSYAQCLRSHGIPGFPDPAPGAPLRIPSSINADTPAFRSAQAACAQHLPAGGNSGSTSESRRRQLLALARCMRKHGITDFADPTTSPPPPGEGNVIGGDGVYLAIGPPANQQTSEFSSAASTCHLP